MKCPTCNRSMPFKTPRKTHMTAKRREFQLMIPGLIARLKSDGVTIDPNSALGRNAVYLGISL